MNDFLTKAGGDDGQEGQIPWARPISLPWALATDAPPNPLRLEDLRRSAAWIDLLVLIVALIVWDVLVAFVLTRVFSDPILTDQEHDPALKRKLLIPIISLRAAGSLAIVGLILWYRGHGLDRIGLSRHGIKMNLLVGLLSLGTAWALIVPVMTAISLLWPDSVRMMNENSARLMSLVPPLPVLGFVALMSVVGFYEEVVFRGFLMPRLRRALGSWVLAVPVSTLLFALPHAAEQVWVALIPITILSLVFSITTIWRRSIIPGVLAHAIFNLSVVLFLKFFAGNQWK